MDETVTLTFGDVAENHVGMQKLGTIASSGFNLTNLLLFREKYQKRGLKTELYDLTELLSM